MHIPHKNRTVVGKRAVRVLASKYMCNAAGTGTKAD